MNYRHIYHAGNFADVFKHILVLMMVDYLQEKEKGLFLLDAFAGLGLYDLNSVEARKTEEFLAGVSKIMEQGANQSRSYGFTRMPLPLTGITNNIPGLPSCWLKN
jgi:23S rRNA A2030 N6-methylase RlmJ